MKRLWAGLLFAVAMSATAVWAADDFTVCQGTYALCTTAHCTAPGQEGVVSCACDVKTGYSAGHESCQDAKKTASGKLMSRYYPVKYQAICSNDRPWANCLDKPCTVNKGDPSKASCACPLEKGQGDYVIVTETYTDSTCSTGIVSSATVQQSKQLNDYLRTNKQLKSFDIKTVNSPK